MSNETEGLVIVHPNRNNREIADLAELIEKYKGPVIVIEHPDDSEYKVQSEKVRRVTSRDGVFFDGDGKAELKEFLGHLDIARLVGCYLSEMNGTKLCVDNVLELCQQIVPVKAYADTEYCAVMRASDLQRKAR